MADDSDSDLMVVGDPNSEFVERVRLSKVEKQHTEQSLITYLFKKILRVLAEGDPLNGTGPTIFLVYAHDSKVGEARAEVSEQLITWLKVVRANLRSDKSPLGPGLGTGTNLDSNDNAAHNILWNQFCLLPPSSYEKSVDKVILCCSEALWNYYQTSLVDSSLQGFPDAVKAAHLSCPKTPKNPAKLHSAIELVVEKHMEDPEFHHVLTELVFLDIRKENRKETDVIPVILNLKPDTYKEIPGFVEGTELWINFESSTTINPDSCRPLHHLFFKLLGRLLPQDDRSVRGFRAVYKDCTRWLDKRTAEESLWSKKRLRRKFKEYVISRIRIVSQTLINDMSAFARTHKTKDTIKGLWRVPFEKNKRFVGRETELSRLTEILSSEEYCESAAVFGLGGMGKTQLVLQYAYQKHESDKDCSVFWVPAFNTTSFMDAYRKIGEMMQIPQIKEKAENIEELVKAIKDKLSDESSGHWLLIIDNVDIFDVLDEDGDEDAVTGDLPLLDCLPNSRKGSIIFTTRNRRAAFDMAGENIIEVKKMNLVEAKALLVKCLDPKTANSLLGDDEAVVDRLLELLTCLPLAITQAGAYMTKNWTTASKYIGYYEENYEEALKLLNRKFRDEGWKPLSGGEYKSIRDPVARTWSISFDQIRKKDELAAEYLSSMACLSHQNIPTSLLPDCFSSRASEAIATLLSYSFISERSPDGPYDMHPLVHLVTREWLEETKSLDIWTKRTLSQIADVFPSEILENRAVWTELLPHAIHALFLPRPPEGDKAIEFDLLRKVGWCLESIGQFEEALKVAKQEVERRKEMFSEDNPSVRWAMSDVGTLLIRLGKYSEAEDWYSRAIELGKTVPGSEDKDTLTIMSMLVAALINQGRLSKAEKLNRQVLLRRMDILGAEHPHTVTSRSKLAVVLSHQGRYSEAEALHRQVLQSRENLYGPENADTLTSKSHLAGVLMSQRCQRKYEEAQEIYEQNLKLDQGMKGPKHPDTLSTMDSLGCLLHYQCKDDEAEKLHQRTLQLREEVLGPTHPMTLLSRSNLALVLNSLGRYDEAEELQMRALKGFRLILGENHPHNLTGMANLANIYLTKGKPKDAGNLTAQVIEKIRTDTGETHPETLASLNRLILLYLDKGMFEDGEILGLQVLEMARHELGDMHCHTLDSMAYLSRLPSKCGEGEKLKETEELQVSNVNPKKRAREDDDTENSEEVTKRAKG